MAFHPLRFFSTPHGAALLSFLLVYALGVHYLRRASYQDPSSLFADPHHILEPLYSTYRVQQTHDFISRHQNDTTYPKAGLHPSICIAIGTVQRNKARYFRTVLASLVEGLAESEREDLTVNSFILNIDPKLHLAFEDDWVRNVSDSVFTYQALSNQDKEHYTALQNDIEGHREKALFDYVNLLDSCYSTSAAFVLVLEDDALAMDGWYHRTISALGILQARTDYENAIYLRLFYNSGLLGWNGQERWPIYLLWSALIEASVLGLLFLLRRVAYAPMAKVLTIRTIVTVLLFCTPAVIILYFAAGRSTMSPLPHGLNLMNTNGCCSQALLFPREKVPSLRKYLVEKKYGFRDSLIEDYADLHGYQRWALTPSPFQHIGSASSKSEDGFSSTWANKHNAELIRNYEYEFFDPAALRREHQQAVAHRMSFAASPRALEDTSLADKF